MSFDGHEADTLDSVATDQRLEQVDSYGIVSEVINEVRCDDLEVLGAVEAAEKCEGEVQWRREVGVEE